jgi:type II secretory pathway component PulF
MLICFLGVAVLLIILGMFMPMIVLIQSLSGGDGTEKGAGE